MARGCGVRDQQLVAVTFLVSCAEPAMRIRGPAWTGRDILDLSTTRFESDLRVVARDHASFDELGFSPIQRQDPMDEACRYGRSCGPGAR